MCTICNDTKWVRACTMDACVGNECDPGGTRAMWFEGGCVVQCPSCVGDIDMKSPVGLDCWLNEKLIERMEHRRSFTINRLLEKFKNVRID